MSTNLSLGELLGLYEPKHPMAIRMSITGRATVKKASAKKKKAGIRNARARKSGRS